MAWAYRRPGDPTSGQVWVDADDPNAIPGTVPIPGHDDPNDAQQMTGQTPEDYSKENPDGGPADYDQQPTPPPQPKTYQTWGSNPYEGWDQNKINAGHSSPKYQVGQVLSNFDPRQGITPDVLAALNALGIGTFEGSGQNLRVVNASPAFEGYTDWGDMIHGYQGGAGTNAAWQYGINNSRDAAGPTAPYTPSGPVDHTTGNVNYNQPGSDVNPFAGHPAGGVWIPSLGQWVPGDHPLAQTPGAINYGAGNRPGSSSSSGGSFLTNADAEIQGEARNQILNLLRSPKLNPNDLRNSPEMQAMQLQAQRAEERDRAALAERAAEGGWSGSGGFEGGLTALRETRGETEMQFMGQLAVEYMERQREDVQRGIEFALNQGQFDQAQALQRELAALEAAIEREKIAANLKMSGDENALERELGLSDIELRRYLGQINSSFDFADLDFRKNQDLLNRAKPPEL